MANVQLLQIIGILLRAAATAVEELSRITRDEFEVERLQELALELRDEAKLTS